MDAYIVIYSQRTGHYGFGEPLRVLWIADERIARAVCSDERTAGQAHFLGWTYVQGQRVRWQHDDGRYDDVLRDLGLRKVREGAGVRLLRVGKGGTT